MAQLADEDANSILGPSTEFYELYTFLRNSSYFTEDVNQACIRFPAVDTLAYRKVWLSNIKNSETSEKNL